MRLGKALAAASLAAVFLLAPSMVAAQEDPYVTPPPQVDSEDEGQRPTEVGGVDISRDAPGAPADVAPAADPQADVAGRAESRGDTLPVTGGDVLGLTLLGLASIGLGTFAVRRARRRPSAA